MNEQISLFLIWMDTLMRQQSNLKLLLTENLLNLFESTTKLARTGEQNQGCSTGEVCWKYFCILLWFYFMSPKWTRTKIVIVITLSLQA